MAGYKLAECMFIAGALVGETLRSKPQQGKRLLEPLKAFAAANGLPLNVLEDHEVSNEAEVHRHEGDLWLCLQGEVAFVYGGEMVDPWAKALPDGGMDDCEIKANEIRGGTERVLMTDDWLWIPAGQPHLHRTAKTARLAIIKIPAKELVPLEAVPGW